MSHRALLRSAWAAVALLLAPLPASAAEFERISDKAPARLRASLPSGKTLAEIPAGTRVEVLDRRVSGTNFSTRAYLRVKWGELEGWIDRRDTAPE